MTLLESTDVCWNRRLSSAIDDPREYWKLTDFIVKVRCVVCLLLTCVEPFDLFIAGDAVGWVSGD